MRVDLATAPGNPQHPNEDFVSVAVPAAGEGGAAVLLDGVTPPEGDVGCPHGVPWFTARLGGALLELAASRRDMTLPQALAGAVRRTADAHRETCDLSHPRTPQATVVAVRWSASEVEYLVLSDSVLLLEDTEGRVEAVLDTRLADLPSALLAQRDAVRALAHGSAERAGAAAAYGRAVEALRNAEGGFFTAAADPAVAARAVTGSRPVDDLSAFAALSDGASRWVEVFHEGDWTDTMALLHRTGPQQLLDRVRAAEAADATGTAHPRGKVRDDASALYVRP
ncbi:hypothetical protein ACFV3R_12900 [Streptomyces sp. NPDC059740]|uniref:hypothetical protein n=1 Tax=Streptomyces sp. NPDC059740 TaxID=3346926 RepID=UPI0036493F83